MTENELAIRALDQFTKHYCFNGAESVQEPSFRCAECLFQMGDGTCLVKAQARRMNGGKVLPEGFGSMSR